MLLGLEWLTHTIYLYNVFIVVFLFVCSLCAVFSSFYFYTVDHFYYNILIIVCKRTMLVISAKKKSLVTWVFQIFNSNCKIHKLISNYELQIILWTVCKAKRTIKSFINPIWNITFCISIKTMCEHNDKFPKSNFTIHIYIISVSWIVYNITTIQFMTFNI